VSCKFVSKSPKVAKKEIKKEAVYNFLEAVRLNQFCGQLAHFACFDSIDSFCSSLGSKESKESFEKVGQ